MPRYTYQAETVDGQVTGVCDAVDVADAVAQLTAGGLRVLAIREGAEGAAHAAEGAAQEEVSSLEARLNRALQQREDLIAALEALQAELPPGPQQTDLLRLTERLRRNAHDVVNCTCGHRAQTRVSSHERRARTLSANDDVRPF